MTTVNNDQQQEFFRLVAEVLDYPGVYMGGPSQSSVRKASRVWDALMADGWVIYLPSQKALQK